MYPRLWFYKEVFNGTLTEDGESAILDLNNLKTKITELPYHGINDVNLGADLIGVIVNTTSVGGTNPTLEVALELSEDGTNWFTTSSLMTISSTGVKTARVDSAYPARYLKLTFTLGGTSPSFTFSAGLKVRI